MNQLSKDVVTLPFDVRPFFEVYEDIQEYSIRFLEPSFLKSEYDQAVRKKVKQLEATYPMIEQGYPWGETDGLTEEGFERIGHYLGMRPMLTEMEVVFILEMHHMMYRHNGEYRYFPIKGVW